MSRQIAIDTYFKSKSSPQPSGTKVINENTNASKKRRSLTLIKTPTLLKFPKYANPEKNEDKKEPEVICLSSDDENLPSPTKGPNISQDSIKSEGGTSNSSQSTIIYALTPQTPVKTPRKASKTPQGSSVSFQSPGSKKFFSPTKKRSVVKRTPVKRNLSRECFTQPQASPNDDLFRKACEGMDDKSIFLLATIHRYLKDNTLTHLLMESSREMLGRSFQVTKPGMRVVCRLYWRQPGWFRRDQLVQISKDKQEVIGDSVFQEMMNSLILNKFITPSTVAGTSINNVSFEEFVKILRADELKQICKDLKLKMASKQDAIEALSAFRRRTSISHYFTGGAATNNAKRVLDIMKSKAGTCYKLSDAARGTLHQLYRLMCLGADEALLRDKRLELVLINDKAKLETYPIDKEMELDSPSVVFRTRDDFTKYLKAQAVYENYLAETDNCRKCKMVESAYNMFRSIDEKEMMRYMALPAWLRRFSPAHVLARMLEAGVQELKRIPPGGQSALTSGQQAPASVQHSPAAGQKSPTKVQHSPAAGQKSPASGKPAPASGKPALASGQQSPASVQQAPAAGQKSPASGQQALARRTLALGVLARLLGQRAVRQHRRAHWWAERALILHKLLHRHQEAAEVLIEGLQSPLPPEQREVLLPRAVLLARQQSAALTGGARRALGLLAAGALREDMFPADHLSKQPMENYKQRGKKKFEIHTEEERKFLDCEEYCIIHYTTNGPFTHGEHWESRIVITIFYLLFWDIIYEKPVGVSGVFLSHYQRQPLDLHTECFYTSRRAVLDERLRRIESMAVDSLVDAMRVKWEERPPSEVSGICRSLGWDNVRMVASCLGAASTGAICRRLAQDYGHAHTGFPDLTLWNAATKKIKFVEVKTDADKPSVKQLQWMRYLQEHGVDVGFCYVGANTTRRRARREPTREPSREPSREPRSMRDAIVFEGSPPEL